MQLQGRKLAFVLAASNHGTMIVNRLDYRAVDGRPAYGVGYDLLESAQYESGEVKLTLDLLALRRKYYGDGVVAVDCGANIGVHTIEWANAMTGWGSVLAIEAQERIFYALAGNLAINNCFNASAIHGAVSSVSGHLTIPQPNYLVPSSFGSLELRRRGGNEFIGQPLDYESSTTVVRALALDELNLQRLDLVKIDIEGMELEALEGAKETIKRTRPPMLIETIKSDAKVLRQWLTAHGYQLVDAGINLLAVHPSDKVIAHLKTA